MDEITAKAMEIDKAQTEAGDGDRDGDREGEIQNPSSAFSSSSSDSDSDSDSDEAAADDTQIQTLESQLKDNPWNYDAHVQYIQSLRKLGHIKKLRQARESMKEHFPLTPKMWQTGRSGPRMKLH